MTYLVPPSGPGMLRVAKDVVNAMYDYRADDDYDWLLIGRILFNIGLGSDDALCMWIEFSKRSNKFKDGDCEQKWGEMYPNDRSICTLKLMSYLDAYFSHP